jgi:hypothetical protein
MDSLSFHVTEEVFIFPSFLQVFLLHRILSGHNFLFISLNVLFRYFLASFLF